MRSKFAPPRAPALAAQRPVDAVTSPPLPWSRRAATVAAVSAAAASIAACGGGTEILAVVGFLGTGGGQYYLDGAAPGFQPVTCGTSPCALTIGVDLPRDPNTGLPPDVFFGAGYAVRVSGNVPNCDNVGGRVDSRQVTLGACLTGQYVSVNEIRASDGRSFFNDFFPNLTTGVWVDIQNPDRRFKFTSGSVGCEITAAGRRSVTMAVVVSNYGTVAFAPATTLIPATRVDRLVVGSETWSGEFIGASGMELRSGTSRLLLERRDQPDRCS
jgi:hypothetical protein